MEGMAVSRLGATGRVPIAAYGVLARVYPYAQAETRLRSARLGFAVG
jgi:hypothetical protein